MKIIACYANKGGVGKPAAAANLSFALATSAKRTLLCDLDAQAAASFNFRVKLSKKLTEQSFFKDVEKFTKAIKASDYDNLDILAANMSFREFDSFPSRMRSPRSRLKQALATVKANYDLIELDCPPTMSALAENVFRAADVVVVLIIPTTLSQRAFQHLVDFFKENNLSTKKLHGFFSMVQRTKSLHDETMEAMRCKYPATSCARRSPLHPKSNEWACTGHRSWQPHPTAHPAKPIGPCARSSPYA